MQRSPAQAAVLATTDGVAADDPADVNVSELLVLRHAQAGDGPERSTPDHERPLSSRGQRDAPRLGRWLLARDLLPDRVLASTARRAVQTADLVREAMGAAAPDLMTEQRLYLASPSDLAEIVLEHTHGCERLLLVGHNPGLAQLVRDLSAQPLPTDPTSGARFSPATLARLELPSGWSSLAPGAARLLDLVRGGQLPDDAS